MTAFDEEFDSQYLPFIKVSAFFQLNVTRRKYPLKQQS